MAGELSSSSSSMDVEEEPAQKQRSMDWTWTVDMEVQLFYAMRGHKPVGVNRHFQMVCIHEKFKNSVQMDVTSQQIWDHLDTMYDMAALHESEIVPFPNDTADFALPDTEFGKQIEERRSATADKVKHDEEVANRTTSKVASVVVEEKPEVAKAAVGNAHQTAKQVSTKKDRQQKETRSSTAMTSMTAATTTVTLTNSAAAAAAASQVDASTDARGDCQQKRKRNTRLQLEQHSSSKPSSPAGSGSATKVRRRT